MVAAQAPIAGLDRQQTLGFVQIVETAERSLTLRDKALTQLLDFTLITSALAVTLMFTFAAWLAWRLARLRRASEIGPDPRGAGDHLPGNRGAG